DVLSTVVDLEAPNANELNALIETAKSNLAKLTKSLIAELK
ncbi:MAG: hypothetical protein ACJAS3_001527, partial [Roseivirga sp.]